MPMDAVCLSAILREVEDQALDGRVDKVYQPTRDEIVLQVRGRSGACRILLSANPSRPRIHLTGMSRENPAEPPMFCMLLRKYLSGGRILEFRQPPMERAVEIVFEASNEMGDRVRRSLVLEAISRRSNLLLLDGERRIVDCLRRSDGDLTTARPLLPGMFYSDPPAQEGKENPYELTEEQWENLIANCRSEASSDRFLLDTFRGISPLLAREAAFDAFGLADSPAYENPQLLIEKFRAILKRAAQREVQPCILIRDGREVDYSFRPILQYGPESSCREMESFGAMLDAFYARKETADVIRQKGQDLIRTVTSARDRLVRKLALQEKELEKAGKRDEYRLYGELITANLYRMQKGMGSLEAENYYDPECRPITIALDPLKTPQQNAARYFKLYTKARTAEEVLTEQIVKGEEELVYIESVLDSIGRAEGEKVLDEIRQELTETGYLRRKGKEKQRAKMKNSGAKPMEFISSTGMRISVGRNNLQNDKLTTKTADKRDYWLHTQKIHGSHVILWTDGEQPDEQSLQEAAVLAAWFSQGREGKKVPVDYTPVKFVKKPAGARPGMVVYTTYKTAYVDPDETLVQTLAADSRKKK